MGKLIGLIRAKFWFKLTQDEIVGWRSVLWGQDERVTQMERININVSHRDFDFMSRTWLNQGVEPDSRFCPNLEFVLKPGCRFLQSSLYVDEQIIGKHEGMNRRATWSKSDTWQVIVTHGFLRYEWKFINGKNKYVRGEGMAPSYPSASMKSIERLSIDDDREGSWQNACMDEVNEMCMQPFTCKSPGDEVQLKMIKSFS